MRLLPDLPSVIIRRSSPSTPKEILPKWRRETAGFHITLRFVGDVTLDQAKALGIHNPISRTSINLSPVNHAHLCINLDF